MRGYIAKVGLRKPLPQRSIADWGMDLTEQEAAGFIEAIMEMRPGTLGVLGFKLTGKPEPTGRRAPLLENVPVPPPNPLMAANCTHCTCAYSTECCYCDGGQVHRRRTHDERPCCHTTGPHHHPACQEGK